MPSYYSSIHILYNPNSTGNSKELATELYEQLRSSVSELSVELIPTERAGHAKELTYDLAKKYDNPLVISVSGDGGYNEVISGAAKAYNNGYHPITAVLGAGNANDHYESVHDIDLAEAIVHGSIHEIDTLKLSFMEGESEKAHYAHSYIGLGITPAIGKELTEAKLNAFKETSIVLKGLFNPKYERVVIGGKPGKFDSIIFSNIDRMAKVLNLSEGSTIDDGKFEVHVVKHKSRWHLYSFLRRAVTRGNAQDEQASEFAFKTVAPLTMQCDGEIVELPANTDVSISINEHPLRCVF